ncbi:MAG: hypothetical protein HKN43_15545 [Rhodothermales bacterium]|nr:hypothetical protein [Rhodothermales bacterium]
MNNANKKSHSHVVAALLIGFGSYVLASPSFAEETLSIPVWADIFNPTGSIKDAVDSSGFSASNGVADYVDLYGAVDAVFAGDNLSNSVATDMSVGYGSSELPYTVVANDTVSAGHDVGNGFVMASIDSMGDLVLYGGVERLGTSSGSSYIEFEFTQGLVQAVAVETALRGERSVDDLLVRLDLTDGTVSGAEIQRWNSESYYETVTSIQITSGAACSGDLLTHLVCDPSLATGEHDYQTSFEPWTEGWDLSGSPISVPAPNAVVEFAVNVGQSLGVSPDFTSIIVRTPQDLILDGFRHMGHWAQLNEASN